MKQTIIVNETSPGLNEWQRMHYRNRMKVKEQWQWLIKAEKPDKHDGAVGITYTRVSTQPMDPDNNAASFKPIADALVKCGVIEDDSPDIVQSLTVQWQKAESQKQQRSIIEISDVSKIKEN